MVIENSPVSDIYPFRFNGKTGDFFRIWAVNLFLSIITLGIYSAWAKVRTLRYFYSNTEVAQANFAYLANPLAILFGRIIAVVLFCCYFFVSNGGYPFFHPFIYTFVMGLLFILIPLILMNAMSFKMRNSAYRNIGFGFHKNYRQLYKVSFIFIFLGILWILMSLLVNLEIQTQTEEISVLTTLSPLLMIILALGFFLFPYLDYVRITFLVNHSSYGNIHATFKSSVCCFYELYLKSVILFILLIAACYALFLILKIEEMLLPSYYQMATLVLIVLLYVIASFLTIIYFIVRRTNLIYNTIRFDKISIISNLKVMPLARLYFTNTIAIVVSGGLLIPWAIIRVKRYYAKSTQLSAPDLDNIVAGVKREQSAIGEELISTFDIDIGL